VLRILTVAISEDNVTIARLGFKVICRSIGRGQTGDDMKATIAEAAQHLGISENAVRHRVKRGSLRRWKRGGRVYVLFDESLAAAKYAGQDAANKAAKKAAPSGIPVLPRELEAREREIDRLASQLEQAVAREQDLREMLKTEQETAQRMQTLAQTTQLELKEALQRLALAPPEADLEKARPGWWRRVWRS